MSKNHVLWTIVLCSFLLAGSGFSHAEVREVAAGVYFRPAQGGCNTGWIVFKDYVLAIDASFPDDAQNLIKDIRTTTDKPIRFAFDTHHHLDHAFGNAVFVKEGATVVSQRACLEVLRNSTPLYERWAENKAEEYKVMGLALPTLVFDYEMVFDDGTMRVELISFGHGHTKGDAIAYLPNEKIAFTGDLCVNGRFNYLGESNLENWIEILSDIQGLKINTICPGHGDIAGKDLLETQKTYFIELRKQVQDFINTGKTLEEIRQSINIPMYEQWTGQKPSQVNIDFVYNELTGLSTPLFLQNYSSGPSPTKDSPGWTPPKKMIVGRISEEKLAELKRVAPDIEFITVDSTDNIIDLIEDADAVMGPIGVEEVKAAKKLRWIYSYSAGVSEYMFPELVESEIVLTNGQVTTGPAIADHVLGFMLAFTKGITKHHERKLEARWGQVRGYPINELNGKTILILGFGGIGSQVAQRAQGFGMTILAIDPKDIDKPRYVRYIGKPDELHALLPQADFVACCVPLTKYTDRYFGKKEFDLMKPTAFFVNIGRGQVVNTNDLVEALKSGIIAGAGLDVTDPEPLPADHPLWKLDNVIVTPHISARTPESGERRWMLLRENVRRFAVGEPLLNVVDKRVGY